MTPQFLRAEAARFREMAEAITDREASRQRLLGMAVDYESRAHAAELAQPIELTQAAEPATIADEAVEVSAGAAKIPAEPRPRRGRPTTLTIGSGKLGI